MPLRVIQTNFTSGELDPRLAAQNRLRAYYNGAEAMANVLVIPQGGFRTRPGQDFIARLPRSIGRVAAGVAASAPNGGTAANANDADAATVVATTTPIGTADPYVVVHYDLGAAKPILFADAVGLKLSAGTEAGFRIQYSHDNAAWTSIGAGGEFAGAGAITAAARTQRIRADVAARYWRVARIGGADLGSATAEIGDFSLWTESADETGYELIEFSFNTEQNYQIVLGDRWAAVVLEDGMTVAAWLVSPFGAKEAAEVNWTQSADTLIVVHPDVQPHRFLRQGSDIHWQVSPLALSNIPQFDFGSGNEPVISATRGWPSAITFHQARLWLGGLKSRPATLLASKVGEYFNLDVGTQQDDEAIDVTLDTDQVNAIVNLLSGPQLQIFTTGAEFVIPTRPITPKNISVELQTRRGSKRFVRPAELDGVSYYIQKGGRALREFFFLDTEQAYRAKPASILAAHILKNPVSMAVRKSSALDDADYIVMVNDDGTVTTLTSLRDEEVKGFTPADTPGAYLRVGVAGAAVFYVVRRQVQGTDAFYLERWNDAGVTDSAVRFVRPAANLHVATEGQTVFPWSSGGVDVFAWRVRKNGKTLTEGADYTISVTSDEFGDVTLLSPAAAGDAIRISFPLATIGGLAHLEGLAVVPIVDGGRQTAKTVAQGQVVLDTPCEIAGEVGLDGAWRVRTMPVERELPDGTMVGRRVRVVSATLRLHRCKGIKVNGNPVAFRRFGPAGTGPLDQPVPSLSGDFDVDGLLGWSGRGQVELSGERSMPGTVLGLALKVAV